LRGERVGDERGGRNFDHHPDLHFFVERRVCSAQFGLAFFDEGVGLFQFIQAGNHGIHHLHIALGAGAEDGAKLVAEQFGLRQAKPDGPPAEKRIHLLRQLQVRGKFVAAQIEGADDDRFRFQRRRHLSISLILFLFRRQPVAVDEQIFRAEQADAIRAVRQHGFDVRRLFDVRGQVNGLAIERDGGLLLDFVKFFFE